MANARQRFWVWRWSLRAPKKRTTRLTGACLKGYRAMRSLSRLSGQIGTSREGSGLGAVVTWSKISDSAPTHRPAEGRRPVAWAARGFKLGIFRCEIT